jgi:hypothetical protein
LLTGVIKAQNGENKGGDVFKEIIQENYQLSSESLQIEGPC